ncbi:MAG: hypothetical protein RL557_78 [archaeon]|jgi:hypothetical protein
MDFIEAYLTIVKRSVEKNTKELPTILSTLDFENQKCLEIGPGPLARLAIKISGFAQSVTCIDENEKTIEAIKN